jgi:hypothetical protein
LRTLDANANSEEELRSLPSTSSGSCPRLRHDTTSSLFLLRGVKIWRGVAERENF